MEKVSFVPGYYEWHLVDRNGNVVLNIPDGLLDDCVTESNCSDIVKEVCEQASRAVECNEELYGVDAKTIEYFVFDIDCESVEKMMSDTLKRNYCLA